MALTKLNFSGQPAIPTGNMPTGSVIQFKKSILQNQTAVGVTATTSDQTIYYGANTAGRTYGDATSITITPTSTSSTLYCIGMVGWTDMALTASMAHGAIITRNDTESIDNSDYPWYNMANAGITYFPSESIIGAFTPNSTSLQTIRLRPWCYIEGGTGITRYNNASLFVMEIAG